MYKFLAITFLIIGLGGCSSAPTPIKVAPNGEYIGWHCEGDINSDEHWRCDKKTLKDGLVVTTATAVEAVTESALSRPVESEVSTVAATPNVVETKSPAPQAEEPESTHESGSIHLNSGFTIQLGAFDSPEQARSVAAALDVEGDIQIRQILSRGTTFAVILMGQYASRAEADAVAETLGINYWVRSLRSLADATVQ